MRKSAVQVPSPDVIALEKRARKHEATIRRKLHEMGGIMGPHMQSLILLFNDYRHHPRPDLVPAALTTIQLLQLCSLPEHRHGVAGAVMGVLDTSDEADDWKASHKQLTEILGRTAPHLPGGEVKKPQEVEFLWMWWMVTGDSKVLDQVVALATRQDAIGEIATVYLAGHGHLPEVVLALVRLDELNKSRVGVQRTPVETTSPRALVSSLIAVVRGLPGGLTSVVEVGWQPEPSPIMVVITIDGSPLNGCPSMWSDLPVIFAKASPEQMSRHRRNLDAALDV